MHQLKETNLLLGYDSRNLVRLIESLNEFVINKKNLILIHFIIIISLWTN